ncbi:TRAP-type C4-dicarboxylate transport system substrate-binding protein [Trueperella bonasi]|uniref:TRAP-type C4-dicarboxylate transport system substrate-binding protein n=1 Tax=Trueperella bonasi TaxID=312286 RepID=A0ABT9NFC6_9ACTO|nr:TRAP transporter substrate-binding protein [Trueperella bonasi]MDP9806086.1 TRAP-type C4-dicarboxylate transport system substrate-binding protein [Trueperella bonasi]
MKRLMALVAAVTMALNVAACGSEAEGRTIRIGSNWAATHPMARAIDEVFIPTIERESGGTLTAETFHAGTLGNEIDLWDGVRLGTIEMVLIGTPMNQEYSQMLISDWPFLYEDIEHAKRVWTGPIAQEQSDAFAKKFPTTEILAWGPNSARTFSSKRPLTTVEDFSGQKFRMPSNPIHIGLAEHLGASAQVIPLGDLFTSLETGVVDGQDNGMVTIISEGFYEVQDYLYETNHIIATLEFIAHAPFMDELTEEEQRIVRDAAHETAVWAWNEYIASVDADRAFLEEHGVTVTQITPEERERLIDMTQPLIDDLHAQYDWSEELTQQIMNAK